MDYLPKRGPKAFEVFIRALVESKQDHIALVLDPILAQKDWGVENPSTEVEEDIPSEPAANQEEITVPSKISKIGQMFF